MLAFHQEKGTDTCEGSLVCLFSFTADLLLPPRTVPVGLLNSGVVFQEAQWIGGISVP